MLNPFATVRSALITAGIVILIALVVIMLWPEGNDKAAQGAQDSRSGTATAETAKDAAATVIAGAERDASVDYLVADTVVQIGATTDSVASGQIARDAICSFPEYSNDPSCD